jgi:hypothetical protein
MLTDESSAVTARPGRPGRRSFTVVGVTRTGGHFMTTGVRRAELQPNGLLRLEWNERLSPSRVQFLARVGVKVEPRGDAGVVEIAYHQVH